MHLAGNMVQNGPGKTGGSYIVADLLPGRFIIIGIEHVKGGNTAELSPGNRVGTADHHSCPGVRIRGLDKNTADNRVFRVGHIGRSRVLHSKPERPSLFTVAGRAVRDRPAKPSRALRRGQSFRTTIGGPVCYAPHPRNNIKRAITDISGLAPFNGIAGIIPQIDPAIRLK